MPKFPENFDRLKKFSRNVHEANFDRIKDKGVSTLADVEKIMGGRGSPVPAEVAQTHFNIDIAKVKGETIELGR